jgi:ribosomal protein S18 acetylase RimI-like enzyme
MTGRPDITTRCAAPSDAAALRVLYQTVFGDDDDATDLFFKTWFDPGLTMVADDGGLAVSVAFILPVGNLVLSRREQPFLGQNDNRHFEPSSIDVSQCVMLYAIGTLPQYRGRGLGEAVTRAAAERAAACGYPAVVLKPAEDSLFAFYAQRCGFQPFFEAAEKEFDAGQLPAASRYLLSPVTPAEYRRLRKDYLAGSAYIDFFESSLLYQAQLSEAVGGGLYKLSSDGSDIGCAVVELLDSIVEIKELLTVPEGTVEEAVAAVASRFPAEKYRARIACNTGSSTGFSCRRFGMISGVSELSSRLSGTYARWYGPAFD